MLQSSFDSTGIVGGGGATSECMVENGFIELSPLINSTVNFTTRRDGISRTAQPRTAFNHVPIIIHHKPLIATYKHLPNHAPEICIGRFELRGKEGSWVGMRIRVTHGL